MGREAAFEVSSVAPERGEGKFEGEGGFSTPPSPSRQNWLGEGFQGPWKGAKRL